MDSPIKPTHGPAALYTPPLTRSGSPSRVSTSHAQSVLEAWQNVKGMLSGDKVWLDGESLDLASLVAVARYGAAPVLDKTESVMNGVEASVRMLEDHLANGDMVYGVNTGFGGSADTRTKDLSSLQRALVQHQNAGVLTSLDIGRPQGVGTSRDPGEMSHHSMPTSWVRGTMLARVNSLIRGHSAVSIQVIERIIKLLNLDLTPVIPLRSSISASGDLSSLSYLAGTLEGNPDIYVRTGNALGNAVVNAPEALKIANMEPTVLAAKEGLGLLNGTAVSVSVASLALYETNQLAVLSQVLTAMGCEALCGTAESFHPFIAAIRPHRGQVEAASNVLGFLSGSRLAQSIAQGQSTPIVGLAQDRYPLRTSSQWIGPQLEDLQLATEQLTVELNSTTDNPLIDAANNLVHHGGNFQAASVTSAMEKTRLVIQMLGKMLFAQGTEMINPALNKGLPPNLAADDPSLSFTCKGIDISLAAYMSELAFLANPVSSGVQSAEMHNQAINSLALISARYAMQAVEVLSLMSAAYLFVVCQALDLRVLQVRFLEGVQERVPVLMAQEFGSLDMEDHLKNRIIASAVDKITSAWSSTTILDLLERCAAVADSAITSLVTLEEFKNPAQHAVDFGKLLQAMNSCRPALADTLATSYENLCHEMFEQHAFLTPQYLGTASTKLYNFVRADLGIPFHRGLVEHPLQPIDSTGRQPSLPPLERKTIGSQISVIYEAIRDGRMHDPVMAAVRETLGKD